MSLKPPMSYLARLEQRAAAWSELCETPTIYTFDDAFHGYSEECRLTVWHHITQVHYYIRNVRSWTRALVELAVEERARFRGCASAAAIREGLARWISPEAAVLASYLHGNTLLFVYLAIRDGSLGGYQPPVQQRPVITPNDRVSDDFY